MEYLTCLVRGDRYGLPLGQVREIVGALPITRVPGAAPALRGLAGHRGTPLPVLDLAARLGFPETAVGRRSCLVLVEAPCGGAPILVGVLVDGVDQIASVDRGQGALPASLERLAVEGVCAGFGEVEGRLVPLLDPEALLRLEALWRLRPVAAARRATTPEARPSPPAPPPVAASTADAAAEAPAPRVTAPGAAAAGREAGGPPRAAAGGETARSDRPRAAGGGGPSRRSGAAPRTAEAPRFRMAEAPRVRVEAPRVRVGVPGPRPNPAANAFPAPGNRPWAREVGQEAPLAVAAGTSPAARASNAGWTPGGLAAAVAVIVLAAGALALLGWRDLGGAGAVGAPASRAETASLAPAEARAYRLPEPSPAAKPARVAGVPAGPAAAPEAPRSEAAAAPAPAPPAAGRPPAGGERIHEVRRGDNLWRLSRRYLRDPERWPAIYQRNRDQIADPNLIEPHQRLVVPAEATPAQGQ